MCVVHAVLCNAALLYGVCLCVYFFVLLHVVCRAAELFVCVYFMV